MFEFITTNTAILSLLITEGAKPAPFPPQVISLIKHNSLFSNAHSTDLFITREQSPFPVQIRIKRSGTITIPQTISLIKHNSLFSNAHSTDLFITREQSPFPVQIRIKRSGTITIPQTISLIKHYLLFSNVHSTDLLITREQSSFPVQTRIKRSGTVTTSLIKLNSLKCTLHCSVNYRGTKPTPTADQTPRAMTKKLSLLYTPMFTAEKLQFPISSV